MSDTKPEVDSKDRDEEGTFIAFTVTIESPKESKKLVDEEEELMEPKFENMDEKDDIHAAYSKLYKNSKKYVKLYRLATKKLSGMELERKELFTKVDEENQTIEVLQFENN